MNNIFFTINETKGYFLITIIVALVNEDIFMSLRKISTNFRR